MTEKEKEKLKESIALKFGTIDKKAYYNFGKGMSIEESSIVIKTYSSRELYEEIERRKQVTGNIYIKLINELSKVTEDTNLEELEIILNECKLILKGRRKEMGYNELKQLYETNKEFKDYVDKYSVNRRMEIWEVLSHNTVEQYALYLINKQHEEELVAEEEVETKHHEYDTEVNNDLGILGC